MNSGWLAGAFVFLPLAVAGPVLGQPPSSTPPATDSDRKPEYRVLRDEEDWSSLRAERPSADPLDRLKFIPMSEDGLSFVSLGGDVRQQYERVAHDLWGTVSWDPPGYLLQRYMFHADAHIGARLRLFGQLKSGIEVGRQAGPRSTDQDRLDFEQAFVDLRIAGPGARTFSIRAGRQELNFGSARVVSVRDGPNVRQTFDGVRAVFITPRWRADAFVTRPSATVPGVFDDRPDGDRSFLGVYAVRRASRSSGIDLYYLRLTREHARYDAGLGVERRNTVGTRLWRNASPLDYNVELVWQFGRFDGLPIRAWTLATDTGWHPSFPGQPRLAVRADVTSGDKNRADGMLGTFNPLFPRGYYFGRVDPLGPYNHIDLHPQLETSLPRHWKLMTSWLWFRRTQLDDGVYSIGGQLLFSGRGSRERFVGHSPEIAVERQLSKHLGVALAIGRFFAGPFLREQHAPSAIDYSTALVSYRF